MIHQRVDVVSSLVYEAHERVWDPMYGCVGGISYLQIQVEASNAACSCSSKDTKWCINGRPRSEIYPWPHCFEGNLTSHMSTNE